MVMTALRAWRMGRFGAKTTRLFVERLRRLPLDRVF